MAEALLPPASTTRRGVNPSKFMGASFAAGSGLEERVENNERKITSLKNIIKLRKVNVDKLLPASSDGKDKDQTIITNNLTDRLDNIAQSLGVLTRALKQQFKLDKKESDQSRRDRQRQEKKDREGILEGPKKIVGGIANTLTKPFRGFFDTIVNFFKNILFGAAILKFIEWLRNPENQAKIEKFKKFLTEELPDIINGVIGNIKKIWPWYTAALVGTVALIGRLIKGIGGLIGRFLNWIDPRKWFKKKPPDDKGDGKGGGGTGVTTPSTEIITDPTKIGDSPGVFPPVPAVEPEKKPSAVGDWFKKRQEQLGNLLKQSQQGLANVGTAVNDWAKGVDWENIGKVALGLAIAAGIAVGIKPGVLPLMALVSGLVVLIAGIPDFATAGATAAGKNFSSNTGEGVFPSQVASSPTFAPKLVASSNIGPPIRQNSTQILNMGGNGGSNQTSNSSQGGSHEPSFSSTAGNGSLLSEGVFGLANA